MPTRYLTTSEAADTARLERKRIIRAIQSNELQASNVGGSGTGVRYRIAETELERWMQSLTVTP